jgi:hypothetical protein
MQINSLSSFCSCHVEGSRDISDPFAFKSRGSSTEPVLSEVEGLGMTNE